MTQVTLHPPARAVLAEEAFDRLDAPGGAAAWRAGRPGQRDGRRTGPSSECRRRAGAVGQRAAPAARLIPSAVTWLVRGRHWWSRTPAGYPLVRSNPAIRELSLDLRMAGVPLTTGSRPVPPAPCASSTRSRGSGPLGTWPCCKDLAASVAHRDGAPLAPCLPWRNPSRARRHLPPPLRRLRRPPGTPLRACLASPRCRWCRWESDGRWLRGQSSRWPVLLGTTVPRPSPVCPAEAVRRTRRPGEPTHEATRLLLAGECSIAIPAEKRVLGPRR